MQKNILSTIINNKRNEVDLCKSRFSLDKLKQRLALRSPPIRDFRAAISTPNLALIAEIKRASPSFGIIKPNFNHIKIAKEYVLAGAAAISVLTDEKFFMGNVAHVSNVKDATNVPVLRKDFIIDSYQIFESRLYGADAILLLVNILSEEELIEFQDIAHELNMQCLVECHNQQEIEKALKSGANIIGINNRDLTTFHVDISTSLRLRSSIPAKCHVVSESGISNAQDILQLKQAGLDAVLVGSSIMVSDNIGKKIKELNI